jgi:hypothetical protein
VIPTVLWAATVGAIVATGDTTARFTAPADASGLGRIIATVGTRADTASVLFVASSVVRTTPYGPFAAWSTGSQLQPNTEPFTLAMGADQPANLVARIAAAKAAGKRMVLAMTGGHHDNYLSPINGVVQFDLAKWRARLALFDTPAIREAVAQGVTDGTILGASVMDEPHVCSDNPDEDGGNTWGPCGTMTKARVDLLCADMQAVFPALPVGPVHRHDLFEPAKNYRTCDFLVSQYSARLGGVQGFRDGALAFGARSGVAILFSMNVLNGGIQDKDGTWDCAGGLQGGKGQYAPNCQMTDIQLREWGTLLGSAGCGLLMWQYAGTYFGSALNQSAFRDVKAAIGGRNPAPCRRVG